MRHKKGACCNNDKMEILEIERKKLSFAYIIKKKCKAKNEVYQHVRRIGVGKSMHLVVHSLHGHYDNGVSTKLQWT